MMSAEVDQLGAAAREANDYLLRLRDVLSAIDPERRWSSAAGRGEVPDKVTALVVEALAGMRPCPHLRRGGPQPAWARLPLHRLDCRRCLATMRRPPPDEGDRCDWCGARGQVVFRAIAIQLGTVVVLGDAGRCCAGVLAWHERTQ